MNRYWQMRPTLLSYTFFERKDQFLMAEDIYDTWICFVITEGAFSYHIDDEKGIIRKGDILLCPPYQQFQRDIIEPIQLHFIAFEFSNSTQTDAQLTLPQHKTTTSDPARLASTLHYLANAHLSQTPHDFQKKQHLVHDLWFLVTNEWEKEQNSKEYLYSLYSSDLLMNDAYQWMLQHAYERFNLHELSDSLKLSPVQFSRRFQQAFQLTPSEFLKKLRMQKASRLLLETQLTLDEIAEQCGYENGFYLSRVFTQFMAVSPSNYRKKNKI